MNDQDFELEQAVIGAQKAQEGVPRFINELGERYKEATRWGVIANAAGLVAAFSALSSLDPESPWAPPIVYAGMGFAVGFCAGVVSIGIRLWALMDSLDYLNRRGIALATVFQAKSRNLPTEEPIKHLKNFKDYPIRHQILKWAMTSWLTLCGFSLMAGIMTGAITTLLIVCKV